MFARRALSALASRASACAAAANPSAATAAASSLFSRASAFGSLPSSTTAWSSTTASASTSSWVTREFASLASASSSASTSSSTAHFATAASSSSTSPASSSSSSMFSQYDMNLATATRFADKVRRAKPTTPGKRHRVSIDRSELWKGYPVRALTVALRKTGGRNAFGRITTEGRGGGHRRRYRLVDFKRSILDEPGVVQRLEYDPNRNAHIALVKYTDGRLQYILAPQELKPGDAITASRSRPVEIKPGNATTLANLPVGTFVHNVELLPGRGGQLARAAGAVCLLLEKERTARKNHALVRITSRETRLIPLHSLATVGAVSNPLAHVESLGKAGRNRWLGWRPRNRGLARNPVDHPHGGGAGAGRPGRPSCGPTAVLAKGFKTRAVRKNSALIVQPRGLVRAAASKATRKKEEKK